MYASQNLARRGYAEGYIADDDEHLPTNPILDIIRDGWDSGDPLSCTSEALFQLARHWSLWQSPRIGTFPLDYRDLSGPVPRSWSDDSGEDSLYYDIDDQIRGYLERRHCVIEWDRHRDWTWYPHRFDTIGEPSCDVQDMIVHAVTVLNRLDEFARVLGHSL